MQRFWTTTVIFALSVLPLVAQGGARSGSIIKSASGQSGTVRICTGAATGTPCAPLATIYSDAALTIQLANPFPSDIYGNYSFYCTPGANYKEQVIAGSNSYTAPFTCPDPIGVRTVGNQTIAGTKTFSSQIVANSGVLGAVTGNVTGVVTSPTTNPATTGQVRLAKTDSITFRNNANSSNFSALSLSGSDSLVISEDGGAAVEFPGSSIKFSNSVGTTVQQSAIGQSLSISTIAASSGTSGALGLSGGGGNFGTANGGDVLITAGAGGLTSGNGGNVILTPGAVTSGTPGTIKLKGATSIGVSGSAISDSRELLQSVHSCGTTATCANTANGSYREIFGTVTLSGGTATVTGISPAFTSTSSFACQAQDNTATNAARCVPATASSITCSGTTTDVISYSCRGN